jgi:hypothetical protein
MQKYSDVFGLGGVDGPLEMAIKVKTGVRAQSSRKRYRLARTRRGRSDDHAFDFVAILYGALKYPQSAVPVSEGKNIAESQFW